MRISVKNTKISAEDISAISFKRGDKPTVSSLIPAANKIIIADAIAKTTDISSFVNINEPKKAEIKKPPKEIPSPPKCGVLLTCELLSFGLAVIFLRTLKYTIRGKERYEITKVRNKTKKVKITKF